MKKNILHNGIELPDNWPPFLEVPNQRKAYPVPYLENKPEVILIDLGRQLFVDDFLILETDLKKVFHSPIYYDKNPVLEPSEAWEKTNKGAVYAAPFSDGVWYDEREEKFKMWYMAGGGQKYPHIDNAYYTCYAESKDGKHWEKAIQDIVKGTNVVDTTLRDAATVWFDKKGINPQERYKLFVIDRIKRDGKSRLILKYSSDGIHWSEPKAISGEMRDRFSSFFNPFTNKWVLSMRCETEISERSRSYSENSDPQALVKNIDKKNNKDLFWFAPDGKEPRHPKFPEIDPGIYNFDVIAYESIFIGFYSVWQGPSNQKAGELGIQKRNEVLLGYSRDGFHFDRPHHKPFFKVEEEEGAWNWGNVQSTNGSPLIIGDWLYFYLSGRRLNHILWDSYMSTGLAKLRRDGFVSMRAGNNEGTIITRSLRFKGTYLFVNANVAHGQLKAEIIDGNFKPIPGFTKQESSGMLLEDKTKYGLSWKNRTNLSELMDKKIQIKFYMRKGDFYSFWISKYSSGESSGYTAGGGPGLHPEGVDLPLRF
ncbi:hypothetical protein [Gramella sp. AN32]|uniref:Uncharacterized protein n=1 Tax=Christiangramia antarctica TaxID=2058158 RepID=A0ABW5X1J9_9FLAO|nr:hypothetical protein [Gramella sp. AN32]MCM4156993.1 hypothetical protein [Gramella sp. AN32]